MRELAAPFIASPDIRLVSSFLLLLGGEQRCSSLFAQGRRSTCLLCGGNFITLRNHRNGRFLISNVEFHVIHFARYGVHARVDAWRGALVHATIPGPSLHGTEEVAEPAERLIIFLLLPDLMLGQRTSFILFKKALCLCLPQVRLGKIPTEVPEVFENHSFLWISLKEHVERVI